MNIFHKRHLVLFSTIFAATTLCGCFCDVNTKIILLWSVTTAALVLFSLFIILRKHKAKLFKVALCLAFASTALISQFTRVDSSAKMFENDFGCEKEISAVVKQVGLNFDYLSTYEVEIYDSYGKSSRAKAIAEFEYNPEFVAGDVIQGVFTINEIDAYSETSSYYKAKGINLYLSSPKDVIQTGESNSISLFFKNLNNKLSNNITDKINGEPGRLVSALFLGNKDLLESSTIRDFRRAGLSHMLAISGTHLAILVFCIDYILKKLRISKAVRGGIVIVFALFYLFLTGFALSTLRAFIMSAMVYLAFVIQDENDMLTSLFLSLFMILLIFPNSVYDIGLWLSFLAVVGIFVAQYFIQQLTNALYTKLSRQKKKDKYATKRPLLSLSQRKIKIIVYIFSCVLITLFVNVFICIPIWLYFNEISLISIISNIIITPLISLVLFFTPFLLVAGFIPPISVLLTFCVENIGDLILTMISFLSSFSKITISTNYPFTGIITVFLAITTFVCLICKLKHKWIIFAPTVIACIAFSCCLAVYNAQAKGTVQIDYENYGESEMLIIKDENQYSIIDISSGGTTYSNDAYQNALDNCATEIDSFILTHYHNYHLNSTRKLLKKAIIHQLLLPYPQNIDEYYLMNSLITTAQENGVNVVLYDSSNKINISANTSLTTSSRYTLKRSSHPTFVLVFEAYGQQFTYFAESAFESYELTKYAEEAYSQSDFAILGTHGPVTKSNIVLESLEHGQILMCADQNILSAVKTNKELSENIISDTGSYRIILSKTKIR